MSPADTRPESRALDGDITNLLKEWSRGDEHALEQMMPLVYDRLQRLASGMLSQERGDHTLQSAALVNEAYMRLVQLDRVSWSDRAHFYALAARMMRRILVDHARRLGSQKRGERPALLPIELAEEMASQTSTDLLALDRAMRDLASQDEEQAQIVEMRYFGGLSRDEIAEVLGIGSATVTRRWRMARAWLFQQLSMTGDKVAPVELT